MSQYTDQLIKENEELKEKITFYNNLLHFYVGQLTLARQRIEELENQLRQYGQKLT